MNMLLWAINVAGLNRAKIRDVIAYRPEPWQGVTGDIVFSACLDDVADTYLATYGGGRLEVRLAHGARDPEGVYRAARPAEPRPGPGRRRGEDGAEEVT